MEEKSNLPMEENKNIIKNLYYNSDNGRFIMTDNQNNSYLCDMFGRQKNLFKSRITGIYNRYEHKKKLKPLLINKTNSNQNKNIISPLKSTELPIISNYQNFNTISNNKSLDYHPYRKRFDDGCGLPKSLVKPFFNENIEDFKEKNKKELVEHLDKYFSNEMCKNNVSLDYQNNKPGLSFLNCDLNDYKSMNKDHKFIIKLIEDTIDKYREQYKNKLNILYKNPVVKALVQFKKYLLIYKDTKVVNGFKLSEPSEKIKEKYKITNNNIKNYFINIKEKNKINDKIIEMYKLKKYKTIEYKNNDNSEDDQNEENELFNLPQLQRRQIIVGPDKLNNLCKSKDFTIGRLLEMDFGFSEEDHKNKINRIKRLGNSAFRNKNNNNKILQNKPMKLFSGLRRYKKNNKKIEDEQNSNGIPVTYKETLESLSNKNQNLNDIYINKSNDSKTLEQKIADNELSFISELSEREKNIQEKKIFRIKSVKSQRNQTELENQLLKGFVQKEEIKYENNSNINKKEHKLKSSLETYKNDINLLKLTNPRAYERQKKEEEHELLLMKKKIELIALLEKNKKNKKINDKEK